MSHNASIELKNLKLRCEIGKYTETDIVPTDHLLDLTLNIDIKYLLIEQDTMDLVFDYDPLIKEIDALAVEKVYETQEYLAARIVKACTRYNEINSLEIKLVKFPVHNASGTLGIHIKVDNAMLKLSRVSQIKI